MEKCFWRALSKLYFRNRLTFKVRHGLLLREGFILIKYDNESYSSETSSEDESLIYYFLKLLSKLQELGTVSALDINADGRVLDSL